MTTKESKKFEREERYVVLKLSDLDKIVFTPQEEAVFENLCAKVRHRRAVDGKPELRCVCIESDWPEYEPVWKILEERMK